MLPYHSFAVAGGTGGMGREIVIALVHAGKQVKVLTRAAVLQSVSPVNEYSLVTSMQELAETGKPASMIHHTSSGTAFPHGVAVISVDYEDQTSLLNSLSGVEVVISAIRGGGFAVQPKLAYAAKKAGVKLFVPSEYGIPTKGRTKDTSVAIHLKIDMQKTLEDLDLPFALFFNGLWMEYWSLCTGFAPTGKFTIVGSGEKHVSTTARPDAARFLVEALVRLPPSELAWRSFRCEGERKTLRDIHTLFERKAGRTIEIIHLDTDVTMAKALANDPTMYIEWLNATFDRGEGLVSYDPVTGKSDVPLSHYVFPGWQPKSLAEVLTID